MENVFYSSEWIWTKEDDGVNCYADFLIVLEILSTCKPVNLYISADAQFVITINGLPLDGSQYADYPNHKIYEHFEITAFLHVGSNRLCIGASCPNEDNSVYYRSRPALRYAIESGGQILDFSGTHTRCRASKDYISGDIEKITPQLGYSFRYDARHYDGWREPDYLPDDEWRGSVTVQGCDVLYARPIKTLLVKNEIPVCVVSQGVFIDMVSSFSPCGERVQKAALAFLERDELFTSETEMLPTDGGVCMCTDKGNGMYIILDLYREEAGYLTFDIDLPNEAEILISWGEHLDDQRVRAEIGGRQFCSVYHARSGRQHFTHCYKRIAGRYIQLHIYAREATLFYAGLKPVIYPVTYKQKPKITDSLHNRIFEVGRRTLELCMHEHYEDCPWREQALYAMDSALQMLSGYYTFEDDGYAHASLDLLARSQRGDGLLELCAPARVSVTIPSFSLCFIIAVYENVIHSEDVIFTRKMLPCIDKILCAFKKRLSHTGLITVFTEPEYWNFYEWRDGLDGGKIFRTKPIMADIDAPLNAFLSMAFSAAAELHRIVGSVHEVYYRNFAEMVNRGLQLLWDEKRSVFHTRLCDEPNVHIHELTQALMVLCGAANSYQEDAILRLLAGDKKPDGFITASLSCCFYSFEALMKYPGKYGESVARKIAKIWGDMLLAGATCFWEVEEGGKAFDRAGSLCHGWSAIPLYFYGRYGQFMFPNASDNRCMSGKEKE